MLPNTPHVLAGLTPAVIVTRGDRQLVIVGGSDNHIFALDADTGERVWQADFTTDAKPSAPDDWLCPNGLTATPVIDKARSRAFAVASDGRLYALSLDDGRVLLSGVHFLPPFSKMSSLTYIDGVLYSTTSQDCNLGRSGVWAINPDSPGRVVRTFYSASSCSRGFCGAGSGDGQGCFRWQRPSVCGHRRRSVRSGSGALGNGGASARDRVAGSQGLVRPTQS
jgi:hypothetical protein